MVPESINTDYFDNDKDNDLIIYKVPDLMDFQQYTLQDVFV